MPQSKHHKKLIGGSILVGLLIGLSFGILIRDYPILKRNDTIDISDIFSLVISLLTLGIGVYIALILDRTKKKEEYKFDYVFSKVEDFRIIIDGVVKLITTNAVPFGTINSKLKGVSMIYQDIADVMILCKMEPIEPNEHKEVVTLLKHIKRLATETSRYDLGSNIILYTDKSELDITNKVITYSSLRQDLLYKQLRDLTNQLFKLVVEK